MVAGTEPLEAEAPRKRTRAAHASAQRAGTYADCSYARPLDTRTTHTFSNSHRADDTRACTFDTWALADHTRTRADHTRALA